MTTETRAIAVSLDPAAARCALWTLEQHRNLERLRLEGLRDLPTYVAVPEQAMVAVRVSCLDRAVNAIRDSLAASDVDLGAGDHFAGMAR